MITNADITIYNRKYDKATRLDTWQRTVIQGVHIYVDHKTFVGDNGLNSAEVYKIRIPADAENADQYLHPEEYVALADITGHWTIQNGDQIVIGVCDLEIEKPSDLGSVYKKHCKVTSWSDNRFGGLQHWRIGGE